MTVPVLGYPDLNREYVLETNASLQGLGAVLSQKDETGKLHMIAYLVDLCAHLKDQYTIIAQQTGNCWHLNGWSQKNFMTIC